MISPSTVLLILLMRHCHRFDYRLRFLEVQKLAYLLQEQGEDLQLDFAGLYHGSYASNLQLPLQAMEGHFISGLGDDKNPDREIKLFPGAVEEAQSFVGFDPDALSRLEEISKLIDGYETPYCMELLTTVHWVSHRERIADSHDVIAQLQNWSKRKDQMFKPVHIEVAMAHLG